MNTFAAQVAFVTGGGSGLGAAIATQLIAQGASVAIADRDKEAAERIAAALDPSGERALAIGVDVTDDAQVAAAIGTADARFGRLDLAVNSAGIVHPAKRAGDLAEADWRRVIDTNLTGLFLCQRHEIAAMLRGGGGAIVNVASALGVIGGVGSAAYAASKHGVIGLTKASALDYATRGIRINAVAPGLIETPLLDNWIDDATKAQLRALHPIGRLGTAAEVAELTCFLLSPAAAFITGSVHMIDGGWTAQ
ncbi:SDR family NAD(P)-dependent oxidoreductase [Sphingomonas sp. Leaf357]|uniref:SDR family NAD(P)-dependent oxidoreductase n=1 Tax=Sphingomonas sp. Leaf357 TaxID=1736350 RepID=UPI000AD30398|nr:SDR family NAD(P)-dependent oxidoreductase [Sphingomonas sp. Leaf357]